MSDAEEAFAFHLRVAAHAGVPKPEREYRFHPSRRWRFAHVVDCAYGTPRQTPDRGLRVVRDAIPPVEIPSAVLLPDLQSASVEVKAAEDTGDVFLWSLRRRVHGKPAQSAILLSVASGRDGSTQTARDAGRRPRKGLGQGSPDRTGQSGMGGGRDRVLVGSLSGQASSGPRECASLLTLRDNGPHADLRLGERERQLPGRERLRRDVSLVSPEVRP